MPDCLRHAPARAGGRIQQRERGQHRNDGRDGQTNSATGPNPTRLVRQGAVVNAELPSVSFAGSAIQPAAGLTNALAGIVAGAAGNPIGPVSYLVLTGRDAKTINQAASGRVKYLPKRPVFRHFPLTLAQVNSGERNPTVGTFVEDIDPAPTIKIAAPMPRQSKSLDVKTVDALRR